MVSHHGRNPLRGFADAMPLRSDYGGACRLSSASAAIDGSLVSPSGGRCRPADLRAVSNDGGALEWQSARGIAVARLQSLLPCS